MALTIVIETKAEGVQQGTQQASAQVGRMAADVEASFKRMGSQTGSTTQRMTQGLNQLAQETVRNTVVQGDLNKAFVQTGQAATTQVSAFQRMFQQYQQANSQFAVMSRGLQQLAQATIRQTVEQGNLARAAVHTGQAVITQQSAFQRMHQEHQKANSQFEVMRRGLQQLSQEVIRNTAVQGNLSKAMVNTGQAAQSQQNQFQRLQARYGETAQEGTRTSTSMLGLARSVQGLAAAFGVVIGAQALAGFARGVVQAGIAQQNLMTTLRAATGSVFAAGEAYTFVRGVANGLGIDLQTAVQGFARLTAVTQDTALQGQATRDLFIAMAEASRVMGLSAADMSGVMSALQQIIGKNVVSMEELRQQLGDRLPQVLRLTATEMGKSVAEMVKMVEKGDLLAHEFIPAVTRAFQTMGKEAPSAAASAQAALARLGNAFFELNVAIANSGVLAAVTAIVERITVGITRLNQLIGGAQKLQGTERITQLQADLINASQAAAREQRQFEERVGRGVPESAAQSSLDNALRRVKRIADEINQINQQITQAQTEEQQLADAAKKRAEAEAAAAGGGGARKAAAQQAVDAAKIQTQLLQERQAQEIASLEIVQQRRRQALEDDYQFAINNTERTEQNKQAIETAFNIRRLDDARQMAIERTEIELRQAAAIRDARLRELDAAVAAERTAAGSGAKDAAVKANADIARLMGERQVVQEEYNTTVRELAQATAKIEADYEKGLTGVVAEEKDKQYKLEQDRRQREAQLRVAQLQGQGGILSAEKALIQAQVQGEVLTRRQGLEELRAIQQREFENRRATLDAQAEAEIARENTTAEDVELIRAELALNLRELDIQQATEQQELLNEQLEGWRRFVENVEGTVSDFLVDLFSGQIDSIQRLFESLKQSFFRMIADMIAFAATRQIIIPIITGIVGGAAGVLGGVSGTGGGGLFDLLGLAGVANQGMNLFGVGSPLGSAVTFLTDSMNSFANTLSLGTTNLLGMPAAYPAGFVGPLPLGATQVSTLGVLGGIGGIAGGLFNAVTAEGIGGTTGGAIGAAGGTAALLASLGIPALAIPGLQPIGLALAALAPLLGNLIDSLTGGRKGPRLAIGNLQGLEITASGGQLEVSGELTSDILRAERIGGEQAIQSELEAKTQQAVEGIVDTINAIAIDPAALLGPTQQALDDAFASVMTVNSSSRKNFEKDIAAQLAFIPVRFAAEFLEPLALAFQQVADLDLDQEILVLPQAAAAMVVTLKGMEEAVNQLRAVENADVLGRIHELETLIDAFRGDLIDSVLRSLMDAFGGGLEDFGKAIALALALPPELATIHAPIGDVMRLAQQFSAAVLPLVADIERLELVLTPLNERWSDLTDRIGELERQIVDAGDSLSLTIPLYNQLREAILAEANLRIQQVQAIGTTLQGIEQTLFQQLTPTEQAQSLLTDIAALEQELAGQTGLEAAETAAELARLYEQLLQQGETMDDLSLTAQAIAGLETLQPLLEQQLIALGGTTDVQEAIKNIQQESLDTLRSMEEDLYNLFLSNTQVQAALHLPVPVVVVNAAQQGGLIHAQMGRSILAEAGEMVFPGPLMPTTMAALQTVNAAFPRFQVGGSGDGDSVPLTVPGGSFVLNKNASRVVRQGFQGGGPVGHGAPGGGGPITINIRELHVRSDQDIERIVEGITRKIYNDQQRYSQRVIRGQFQR